MSEPEQGKGPGDLFPGERLAMEGQAWVWRNHCGIAMDGFDELIRGALAALTSQVPADSNE